VELYKNKQRENFKIYLVLLPEIKPACVPQIEGKWPMYCSNQLAFIFTNNMEDKTRYEKKPFSVKYHSQIFSSRTALINESTPNYQ